MSYAPEAREIRLRVNASSVILFVIDGDRGSKVTAIIDSIDLLKIREFLVDLLNQINDTDSDFWKSRES